MEIVTTRTIECYQEVDSSDDTSVEDTNCVSNTSVQVSDVSEEKET